jgi:hypothetical protein
MSCRAEVPNDRHCFPVTNIAIPIGQHGVGYNGWINRLVPRLRCDSLYVVDVCIDPLEELTTSVWIGNVHVSQYSFECCRILVGSGIPSIVVSARSSVATTIEHLLFFVSHGKLVLELGQQSRLVLRCYQRSAVNNVRNDDIIGKPCSPKIVRSLYVPRTRATACCCRSAVRFGGHTVRDRTKSS